MSDEITIQPTCGQCGAELLIEHEGAEADPDDKLICPIHGGVSTVREARQRIADQVRKNIADVVRGNLKSS